MTACETRLNVSGGSERRLNEEKFEELDQVSVSFVKWNRIPAGNKITVCSAVN